MTTSTTQPTPNVSAAQEKSTPVPIPVVSLNHLPSPYNEANYLAGKKLYMMCSNCHSLEAGKHSTGPSLHNIINQTAGTRSNYSYSTVLLNTEINWTPENMDTWIEKPSTMLPGNKMNYEGMRRPEQRRDLIAYLLIEASN